MIVKVLKEFYDKENLKHIYKVGDVVEFADSRAEDIISRGFGEAFVEKPKDAVTENAETLEKPEEKVDAYAEKNPIEDVEAKETPAEENPVEETEVEEKAETPVETEEEAPKKRGRKPKATE